MHRLLWLFLAATLWGAAFARAAEPVPRYNTVELQAEAQREVQNDLLNAMLYVEVEDASAAVVANAVNTRVNEALRITRDYKSVRVRSGNNQTYPVYSKGNTLQGWRGRGEIRIDSMDSQAASELIGKLQASLQLGNISFSVSPETRRRVENELITEAINAFKARAEIIKSALAGRGYKLQRLNVASDYNAPQPRLAMARAPASSEVATPNFEGGVSRVTVRANGAIEVIE